MKKQNILAVAAALAIALPLAACGGTSGGTASNADSNTQQSQGGDAFDPVALYNGQWRASVEMNGSTVYGDVSGSEPMLDVFLNEDGTCSIEPLESHADLLTAEGTWEGTETQITLDVDGKQIVMTVIDENTLEANPTDFGIEGFETLDLTFY